MGDRKIELDAKQHEYLNPTQDRMADQKIIRLVADYAIGRVEGERVLEMGVGDQIWTPRLVKKYKHVTTIEGSQVLLDAMRKSLNVLSWTPVCTLFEEYEPKEKFDTVFATYVLEHVDDPAAIVRQVKEKWLKPGGKLVVIVPHALSLHRRLAVCMGMIKYPGDLGEADHLVEHHRCFTCYEMHKLLVEAGYKVVESKGMITKVLPNSMLAQCTDEQLRGLFNLGLELPIEYAGAIYFLGAA